MIFVVSIWSKNKSHVKQPELLKNISALTKVVFICIYIFINIYIYTSVHIHVHMYTYFLICSLQQKYQIFMASFNDNL